MSMDTKTVAKLDRRCDICASNWGCIDAPTIHGPWALMCKPCFSFVGGPAAHQGLIGTMFVVEGIDSEEDTNRANIREQIMLAVENLEDELAYELCMKHNFNIGEFI